MGSETELPAVSYRLPVGPQPRYTANLNLIAKVLDFVKFGGPILTIGGTVFEVWLGLGASPSFATRQL